MRSDGDHDYLPTLKRQLAERRIDRREFLRTATLLGMSAVAAYAFCGQVAGTGAVAPARAQAGLPRGGTLRLAMHCQDLRNPHAFDWIEASNSGRLHFDYLTVTGPDNITRPALLEKWSASADLKTWTLSLRRDVKWHDGRSFTADDALWNIKRVLDPKSGSSVLGLLKGFLLRDVDAGETDAAGNARKSTRLWDASAIEKVDDFTIRLNGQVANLAVPEQLFHYPFFMLDPRDGGVFTEGSNGTGPFQLVENAVSRKQVFKANRNYWGGGPFLDQLEYVDLGDDPAASIAALAARQVDGLYQADPVQLDALNAMRHLQLHQVTTAYTAVARMHPVRPFDDRRVRQAMRLAVDPAALLEASYRGIGLPGEHHHVSPVHPEYAKIPAVGRDVGAARRLLAEAGHPDGIDAEIACRPQPAWELACVQAMVQQWKEAGIRVKINVMPSTQYWENWTKVPFGFTTWAHRPLGVMTYGLAYRSGVPWNEANWSNPEFDKLLDEAEGALDVEMRRALMARLEQIMLDDGPIVQPVWRGVFTFMDKKVKGFRPHPTGYIFGQELAIQA